MPKHVIRIPPLKAGRSVSWTFEVSAADDAERGARAKKARKKRQAKKPAVKGTRMARVRREPDVVTEWAATSDASQAIPTPETAHAVEPAPAIETTPAVEMTPAIEVTPAPLAAAVAAPRQPGPAKQTRRLRPFALIAASFGVVAALAFPRRPLAPGTNDGAAITQPSPTQTSDVVVNVRPAVLPAATTTPVASAIVASSATSGPSKKALAPKPEKSRTAQSTTSAARLTTAKPIASISLKDAETKLPAAEPIAPLAPAATSTSIVANAPVTITGCLEMSVDRDEYRLTDTDGAAAPKSRSWRTGFLKKRSAPIALIAPSDAMALQTHVGHRVSATGVLTSHDLKVSTFRVVGPACN
jgi:hypothetical protein